MAAPIQMMTIKQAANWLNDHGCKANTSHLVRVALLRGELAVAGVAGKLTLILANDVEAFAKKVCARNAAA